MEHKKFIAVYLMERAKDAIENDEIDKAINFLVKAIMHLSNSI